MKLSTENIKRKNPINRNNLFFSQTDFEMQMLYSQEYMNNVVNQTVVLYQVDLVNTSNDDIYKEANFEDISFKTPIELNVLYKLDEPELKTYDTNMMRGYYIKVGKLTFSILGKELEENECDIKRGDYIGLQVTPEHMEYFIVSDDGRVNFDNKHTMFGTKPYYRNIVCNIVSDKSETKNL